MLNLLMSLREELQLSMLFVSHDLSVVKFMSDRIMVMRDGGNIEIGNSDEVLNHPKSVYTKGLIASLPKIYIPETRS